MEPAGKIRCSVCGQDAAEEARFCRRCGARLPRPLDGSFRPASVDAGRDPPKGDNR